MVITLEKVVQALHIIVVKRTVMLQLQIKPQKKIKMELKNWNIPKKLIKKKYGVSESLLRHINEGNSWYDEKEQYPLRKEKILNEIIVQKIIKDLILTDIPMNHIGLQYGWGRSSAKMINCGKNHFNKNLIYPIRENKEQNKTILSL